MNPTLILLFLCSNILLLSGAPTTPLCPYPKIPKKLCNQDTVDLCQIADNIQAKICAIPSLAEIAVEKKLQFPSFDQVNVSSLSSRFCSNEVLASISNLTHSANMPNVVDCNRLCHDHESIGSRACTIIQENYQFYKNFTQSSPQVNEEKVKSEDKVDKDKDTSMGRPQISNAEIPVSDSDDDYSRITDDDNDTPKILRKENQKKSDPSLNAVSNESHEKNQKNDTTLGTQSKSSSKKIVVPNSMNNPPPPNNGKIQEQNIHGQNNNSDEKHQSSNEKKLQIGQSHDAPEHPVIENNKGPNQSNSVVPQSHPVVEQSNPKEVVPIVSSNMTSISSSNPDTSQIVSKVSKKSEEERSSKPLAAGVSPVNSQFIKDSTQPLEPVKASDVVSSSTTKKQGSSSSTANSIPAQVTEDDIPVPEIPIPKEDNQDQDAVDDTDDGGNEVGKEVEENEIGRLIPPKFKPNGDEEMINNVKESSKYSSHPYKHKYAEIPNHNSNSYLGEGDIGEDSGYFTYFVYSMAFLFIGFLIFQNKKRLIALLIEGRRPRGTRRMSSSTGRRRSSSAGASTSYRKLENNFD